MTKSDCNEFYTPPTFLERLNCDDHPVLIFDGATGTSIQNLNLKAKDFGGADLEGCNENLVITRPDIVEEIHNQFLRAGCDVIETNTFGSSPIVLSEYGLQDKTIELNEIAAQIARKAAEEFTTQTKPRYVAGSIGPTTKLPTLGHISFDELVSSYQIQIKGLIKGGVDLFIIETCQDVLQIKAAIEAINKCLRDSSKSIPIMVSITMETTGTMLLGTDIAAALSILGPYSIDILGLNCATGPTQMKEHIQYLSKYSPFILSCIPNAGLPENIGGVAHYRLTPLELKMQMMHFIKDLGVKLIGGCCGTTPDHIKCLSELVEELAINNQDELVEGVGNQKYQLEPSAASIYTTTTYKQENSFLIVGERLNASGSKRVRDLLNNNDWDGLVSIAKTQVKENAHILDVNVDYVGRDGVSDMKELVSRLVTNVNLPLMLDSTEWEKMESGLKVYGGKSILNSTNYEDGNDRFFKVLELAKKYGAGVVVGTIDEEGMARTASRKFAIAKRAYKDAINFGIAPHEIFYDPLALPISTGIEEDRRNGIETIKSIEQIRAELRNVHIILGISNISFGLNPAARITLNSVFLDYCCKSGLDSAIVSPAKILPLSKISEEHKKICYDLIEDKRIFKDNNLTYDPLTKLTTAFEGISTKQARESDRSLNKLPLEERLSRHIIDGEKLNIEETLNQALESYKPLEIINNHLLSGMKVVGELFGSGQMQLPFVLQSAETMKQAVSYLEPFMDKEEGQNTSKGKLLIATVKGDVHDIGKNLVDIILTNNGYEVINLGIKQDVSAITTAQKRYNADCIAMSGLLVKSTAFMKENLNEFNNQSITVPVILGGAALTPRFVNKDCSDVYKGMVIYGKDAFTDLKFMDAYMEAKKEGLWDDLIGFKNGNPEGITLGDKNRLVDSVKSLPYSVTEKSPDKSLTNISNSYNLRSPLIPLEPTIKPPFIGAKIVSSHETKLKDIVNYLDKNALFSSQWQMKRIKSQSKADYQNFLKDKAEPILNKWLEIMEEQELVSPSAVYGYFPCGSEGNKLMIFDPINNELLGRFEFPRQKGGNKYCISDFFNSISDGKPTDYIAMQAVTMGEKASLYSHQLFKDNKYSEYLFFHGLAVQLAESLAETIHAKIRIESGFGTNEPSDIKGILAQKYRGCRYSFGYPACPNVGDSRQQLKWLGASQIGLSMDSSDQLYPEQSTTAIVVLHSKAKYFSV